MLILVSKAVFVSVCTPLVAIRFSPSARLVSSNLLSCRGGGGLEEAAEEREGALLERENKTSKRSRRLKYDIHLPGSRRDRDLEVRNK
jgi:hypothetical protein